MSGGSSVFAYGSDRHWAGIPHERALEWTRVLLERRPSVPGTVMHRVRPDLERGKPAGFSDWAERARVAEAIGLAPASYEALHAAFDEIDPAAFPAHPDRHLDFRGLVPVRRFDAARWAPFAALVESGLTPRAAAERLLRRPAGRPEGLVPDTELGRTIQLVDRSAESPVVLHAPHAGTLLPASCRAAFTATTEDLMHEHRLLADHATDRMVRLVDDGSSVAPRLSRLVVDVERFDGNEEEMNAVGMGVLYTHGSQRQRIRALDDAQRAPLLAYFHDYVALVADLVDATLERHGRAIVVDVHSYPAAPLPYELHADDARPELCIGVDPVHTPRWLVDAVRVAFGGWEVAVNEPFRGTYVPLRHLGDPRVSSVMLEIRRDRYLSADGEPDDAAVTDVARRIGRLAGAVRGA